MISKIGSRLQNPKNNDEKWSKIVETCLEAGIETLGIKEKTPKQAKPNKDLKNLADTRQRLKNKIEGSNSAETRKKLEEERKNIKKKIK